ncbi:hypothetical protein SERLA73DRAFT_145836, partial [Serpula lacrymans var. lacrymans S7.3]
MDARVRVGNVFRSVNTTRQDGVYLNTWSNCGRVSYHAQWDAKIYPLDGSYLV